MINAIFDLCVNFLVWLAGVLGITYQEVNVWIFVIIWPLLTVGLISAVIAQQTALRKKPSRLQVM